MMLFLKNLLFTILIPGTVAVYFPLLIARGRGLTGQLYLVLIGGLLLISRTAIYAWTVWDFASFGRGTPLPIDAPKKLVVRGLYHSMRNPMYLGVILVILGWACLHADVRVLLYALGVALIVHLFVIIYEEPRLTILFGEDYMSYKASVGRWLPRLNRKHHSE